MADTALPSPPQSEPEIDADDNCPVCCLLLFDPVTTTCNHTLCKSCMVSWADMAPRVAEPAESFSPTDFSPQEIEATCPMCRTKTSAGSDDTRAAALTKKYPEAYAQRQIEEERSVDLDVQYMTLYVGNKHKLKRAARSARNEAGDRVNQHEWTFFVRTSRDDVLHSVFMHTHPDFDPSHILKDSPPFEIRRLGWGTFCILATVILKSGWVWANSDADTFERKKFLRLHWSLDFENEGSMHRHRLKYRRERPEDRQQWDQQQQAQEDDDDDDEDDEDFAPMEEDENEGDVEEGSGNEGSGDEEMSYDDESTDESDDEDEDLDELYPRMQCAEVERQILASL